MVFLRTNTQQLQGTSYLSGPSIVQALNLLTKRGSYRATGVVLPMTTHNTRTQEITFRVIKSEYQQVMYFQVSRSTDNNIRASFIPAIVVLAWSVG